MNAILAAVPRTGELSMEKLRWTLARQRGATSAGGVSRAFDQSFARSVRTLTGKRYRLLRIDVRKLETIEEMVELYPFKSRLQLRHELRVRLLPRVAQFVDENPGGRFNDAARESFAAGRAQSGLAAIMWSQADNELLALESRSVRELREQIFLIRARGSELFVPRGRSMPSVTCSTSLGRLIDTAELVASDGSEKSVLQRVREIYSACLPASALQHVNLKSTLYAVANLQDGQRPRLTDDFRDWLLTKERAYLEAMQGHKPAPPPQPRRGPFPDMDDFLGQRRTRAEFDPALDLLIDRDLYLNFRFLRRTDVADSREA